MEMRPLLLPFYRAFHDIVDIFLVKNIFKAMVLNAWTVLTIRKHRVDVLIPAREKISAASGKQHLSPESFVIGNNRKKRHTHKTYYPCIGSQYARNLVSEKRCSLT